MNDTAPPPASNVPEYAVSEISGAVKRTLEGTFGRIRVRGEISEFKHHGSGHMYFCLKDEGAKLAAVVWRSGASRLGLRPEDGVEVIATGRITTYGERSTYQLIVDRIEYAGEGALLARVEKLRQRLAAEGLFDADRKRRLPLLPDVIGIVTSPQGAVLQDIRTTIARRFPRHLLVWPVAVQGDGAAERIARAIAGFDALPAGGAIPRPDLLIVARGGGSLEDLMAFNDEAVVRAAAACSIPLISAVGHETDTTLIDHASDRRAPTPTAAAEMAVPSRAELAADLAQKRARLAGGLHRLVQESTLALSRAVRGLPDLPGLLGAARQRLDDRALRLERALPSLLAARRTALLRAERAMPDARGLIERRRSPLAVASATLGAALRHSLQARGHDFGRIAGRLTPASLLSRLRERRLRLDGLAATLEAVSYRGVLDRGFVRVSDASGRTLTRAAGIAPGDALALQFADGTIAARAEDVRP
ncbi:MAG TPA: exodeoxyribonuclease VII large subunit [Acetobacteraceae bacterium]|jgi:exodeoxyribonuclease VII large subunit|nr:exodeoxyribonuclease VII large subunit [Acetobacteraceae bacterium]